MKEIIFGKVVSTKDLGEGNFECVVRCPHDNFKNITVQISGRCPRIKESVVIEKKGDTFLYKPKQVLI